MASWSGISGKTCWAVRTQEQYGSISLETVLYGVFGVEVGVSIVSVISGKASGSGALYTATFSTRGAAKTKGTKKLSIVLKILLG